LPDGAGFRPKPWERLDNILKNEKGGSRARRFDEIVLPGARCPGEAKLHPGLKIYFLAFFVLAFFAFFAFFAFLAIASSLGLMGGNATRGMLGEG
jgi:hypothetical protein